MDVEYSQPWGDIRRPIARLIPPSSPVTSQASCDEDLVPHNEPQLPSRPEDLIISRNSSTLLLSSTRPFNDPLPLLSPYYRDSTTIEERVSPSNPTKLLRRINSALMALTIWAHQTLKRLYTQISWVLKWFWVPLVQVIMECAMEPLWFYLRWMLRCIMLCVFGALLLTTAASLIIQKGVPLLTSAVLRGGEAWLRATMVHLNPISSVCQGPQLSLVQAICSLPSYLPGPWTNTGEAWPQSWFALIQSHVSPINVCQEYHIPLICSLPSYWTDGLPNSDEPWSYFWPPSIQSPLSPINVCREPRTSFFRAICSLPSYWRSSWPNPHKALSHDARSLAVIFHDNPSFTTSPPDPADGARSPATLGGLYASLRNTSSPLAVCNVLDCSEAWGSSNTLHMAIEGLLELEVSAASSIADLNEWLFKIRNCSDISEAGWIECTNIRTLGWAYHTVDTVVTRLVSVLADISDSRSIILPLVERNLRAVLVLEASAQNLLAYKTWAYLYVFTPRQYSLVHSARLELNVVRQRKLALQRVQAYLDDEFHRATTESIQNAVTIQRRLKDLAKASILPSHWTLGFSHWLNRGTIDAFAESSKSIAFEDLQPHEKN